MTYWILTKKRTVIARSSVPPLSEADLRSQTIQQQMEAIIKVCFAPRDTGTGSSNNIIEIFPKVVDDGEAK